MALVTIIIRKYITFVEFTACIQILHPQAMGFLNHLYLNYASDHVQRGLLCLCVLEPKLASRMFIRAKNDTTYLTHDADQIICGNFAINASFISYGVRYTHHQEIQTLC